MALVDLALDADVDKHLPHYVYVYYDTRPGKNNEPIYVGKGTEVPRRPRFRAEYHWAYGHKTNEFFLNVLAKIRALGLKPIIGIVERFANEDVAHAVEVAMIKEIGRRDLGLGPLCNLTDGGEGVTGYVPPPEVIEKHRRNGKLMWLISAPEVLDAMAKVRRLWADPAVHSARKAAMQAARDRETPEERAVRNAAVKVAKKALGHITSAQVSHYYATASEERLIAHALAISEAKLAAGRQTGDTSREVWAREGMNQFISAAISVGQKKAYAEPRGKQRRKTASINHKKQFSDPVTRETHSKGCSSRMKADWADPVKREAMLEARRVKKVARLAEAGETLL